MNCQNKGFLSLKMTDLYMLFIKSVDLVLYKYEEILKSNMKN